MAEARPRGYVNSEYLQAIGAFVKHLKKRTYALMEVEPGQKALDVGCGPATDTIELAALVGPTGKVFGVDHDPAMIQEAEQRAEQAGVAAFVKHKQADTGALPFETGYFDACRSERVFQHLLDPARTLSEMIRVTKSGGRIVVLDNDYGTLSIDTTETDIERRLARVRAEALANNGYCGRQLYRMFKQQGLADVTVELHPLLVTDYAFARYSALLDDVEQHAIDHGIVTGKEIERWQASMEQADSSGSFYACVTQVMAFGRKP